MKYVRYIFFTFFVLMQGFAHAQSDSLSNKAPGNNSNILTLDQAIDLALLNNYDIRLAKNVFDVAANDYAYRNFLFTPTLNANAANLWNSNTSKQKFETGPPSNRNNIHSPNVQAQLQLNWKLFDGMRMFATRNKLEAINNLGETNVKVQLINTISRVIRTYYNVVQEKQQLRAIQEQMSISEERVKLSDAKFTTGLGPKTDLLQAKVDYNAQKAAYLRQLTVIDQTKDTLNQVMAARPANNVSYEVEEIIPINMDLSFGDLESGMNKNSLDIKSAAQNVEVYKYAMKEYKGNLYPQLYFNSAYNFSRTIYSQPTNQFSPISNLNRGYNYGFTLNVPIFNGFSARQQYQDAKLNVEYYQLNLENVRTKLALDLNNSFKDYEYYKQALSLEQENLELAKENAMVALERFKQGVSTTIEVKQAQQSLEDSQYRLIQARFNAKVAETELLRLKGELLK
ncbi:TolC family protein [Chitinophaga parva]|nr:TolC family protein [Chitinophaga parva]